MRLISHDDPSTAGGRRHVLLPAQPDLHFCDSYRYPPEVGRHLELITEALSSLPITALLLHGSTSRGELSTWRHADGTLEVLSDYEFLAATHEKVPDADQGRVFLKLRSLETGLQTRGQLFHIDVSFLPLRRVRRLPRIVRTHEAKTSGMPLLGADLRDEIPAVFPGTLDRRDLNDILLWRVWSILLHYPTDWLFERAPSDTLAEPRYVYVLCRNSLDLLTWALPHEDVLLSSFGERFSFVRDNWPRLRLASVFGPGFRQFQERCLMVKLQPQNAADMPATKLLDETFRSFVTAARYLLELYGERPPSDDGNPVRALNRIAPRAFVGSAPADRLRSLQATFWLGERNLPRLASSVTNAQQARANMLVFLYEMFAALWNWHEGHEATAAQCTSSAASAMRCLSTSLAPAPYPRHDWLQMRQHFALHVLPAYVPSLQQKRGYLSQILDQTRRS